ncbi:MAG: hypothetical protein HYW69_00810 [Candidatus Nealsonbacteria bacterium]|nr:hypothetical protein [Candidatus Nealsonbacteria bacterium]
MGTFIGVVAIIIGIGALTALLVAVSAVWKGFVLLMLWKWFIVPIFGLPELPLVAAIGVGMVISFLTYQQIESKSNEDEDKGVHLAKSLGMLILYPAIVLFFGWIVHLFM